MNKVKKITSTIEAWESRALGASLVNAKPASPIVHLQIIEALKKQIFTCL